MPKILLVEDNELNRDMLSRRLKRRGYDVVIADNGAEGVAKATSDRPDLILMDMSLPVMNGWQATKTLKAGTQTASIPIIALTAHAMVGDREEAIAAGCDDYDTKPVDLKRLLQKIEKQLLTANARPTELAAARVAMQAETPIPSQGVSGSEQPITAPVETLKQSPSITQEQKEPIPLSTSSTLLVVDDNEANRDMLSRRLERKGYEVILAESGEAALQVLAKTDIDLVLLDIMMPGIGGIETLRRIRLVYSQAQLPVIMATAKDTSEDVVQALDLGANDYITKPIDLPVALARIHTHLKTREGSHQLNESSGSSPSASFWEERYRQVEVLSENPFGQTVIAEDRQDSNGTLRLIHTFRLDTNNPDVLQATQDMFLAEMVALKQIQPHEQFIPLISYLQDGETFYIVHEYIEGTLLSQSLEAASPLTPKAVCKIADDILTIIEFLHQSQVIHSHPHSGCFLRPAAKSRKLVLVDYGITTRLLSKLGQQYPHYQKVLQSQGDALAPELISGNFRSDTDLYAVGKTLLQALQHQIPASEQNFIDLFSETTHIFAKMCQTDPENRYPSIYDACRAVRNHWHKLWKAELSLKNSQN